MVVLKMGALLKTVLLRTAVFSLWIALSAWLFSLVEYTQTNDGVEKYKSLLSLYISMKSKYNMTAEEFDNFTKEAHEALIAPKLQWTYSTSFDFVFQALTTIGKAN